MIKVFDKDEILFNNNGLKIVSINKKRILQTVKMRSGKILFFRLVVIRLRDGR